MVKIIINTNESIDGRIDSFFPECERKAFDIGDFTDDKERGYMERKTWSDLWKSIVDGRVDKERWDMIESGKPGAWVIEGSREEARLVMNLSDADWEKIDNKLYSIQVIYKQAVRYTKNLIHTVKEILHFFDIIDRIPCPPPVSNPYKGIEETPVAMLCGIKGCGAELGKLIMEVYKDIPSLCDAIRKKGNDALTFIKGIGDKKAELVINGVGSIYGHDKKNCLSFM